MHSLFSWFTKNPVAANLLMILILISGYFTVTSIRIEAFPPLPVSSVTIHTISQGASPAQIDSTISRQIELALEGMPGIKKITSNSSESLSIVRVKKNSDFDLNRFQNEIQARVNAIENFPKAAQRPIISRDEFSVDALLVQVFGSADKFTLQKTARIVKHALISNPYIAKIEVFGLLPYEISIEIDESKLISYGLTLSDLARAINDNSFDYDTGTLKSESGKIIIKADNRAVSLEEFRNIPILAQSDGRLLKLEDVANVVDGFEEVESFARFQGTPSVGMLIYSTPKGDLLEVSKAAHKVVDKLQNQLPHNIKTEIWGESSIYMKARLNLLKTNAIQGLCIVFALLSLFLNVRLAFWVAMGIPISIAGTLAIMGPKFLDYSLNDVTTFGLIIVLGILVDDAVVIGESVFEQRSKTKDPVEGTIKGVSKVATATIFGGFTTIAAFYPSLLIDNELGKIFASFSVVVIISLFISLIESKLILPAHLAAIPIKNSRPKNIVTRFWAVLQGYASSGLEFMNSKVYKPMLKLFILHRYSFLLFLIIIVSISIGLIYKKQIRAVFFPEVPGQIIIVEMEMINGSPTILTKNNLNRLEKAALEVNKEVMNQTGMSQAPIVKILSILEDEKKVQFYAELQPEKIRKIDTLKVLKKWRDKVSDLEGVRKLTFSGSFDTAGGFEIDIKVGDENFLQPALEELQSRLKNINGVYGVYSDMGYGNPQVQLKLKPQARHLGITASDLAVDIGNAFGGLEVQRFLRQTDEIKVKIKYPHQKRQYIGDLMAAKVLTPSGDRVPLSMIADIETGYTSSNINRKNHIRLATIKAQLDKDIITPSELFSMIQKKIQPDLVRSYPGLMIMGAGELEEIGEMKSGLIKAFIIILIGIYALLAIPLKSYFQPIIIMSVIPFAFVGAIIGHKLTGFPISILSVLGVLGAAGVVVNDSLVMLTQFNDLINKKHVFSKAVIMAGSSRFRAIFLTTATTVAGLMPLIFETSEQAQYLIPAAVSLAFGELFATPVTLMLIPILLSVSQDIKKIIWRKKQCS